LLISDVAIDLQSRNEISQTEGWIQNVFSKKQTATLTTSAKSLIMSH